METEQTRNTSLEELIDQQLGRRSEALCVYQRCRAALSNQLRVEPSFATQAIYRAIRAGEGQT